MRDLCLSINAGSSSLKTTVFRLGDPPTALATATVSGLTAPPVVLKYHHGDAKVTRSISEDAISPSDAFHYIARHLREADDLQEVGSEHDFTYLLHRVVHGGKYERQIVIDEENWHYLEDLADLAPLSVMQPALTPGAGSRADIHGRHNYSSLHIIRVARDAMPRAKNIAFFDSVFHQSMPDYIRTYPIDQEIAERNWLRKYGFHGISYAFIAASVARFLRKPEHALNIIALHLGSGMSACAIQHGKSLDTSMGLTPLAGLPGATRSGSIDPSLVFHYTSEAGRRSSSSDGQGMHVSRAEELLNKKAGWKALTGTTDFAKSAVPNPPSEMHRLAFDIVVDRIIGFIGSYYLKLGGEVDALVFAAGIGEKSAYLREAVVEKCRCLGFCLNKSLNDNGPGEDVVTDISGHADHGPRVLICQTDEMLQMAKVCSEWHATHASQ
ncbi:hypothetical protein KEM52_003843 [Ascosphaera acerosa]|nr:hypothetical protein KEM52_003843 [Ascosphaera acerosa]